MTRTAYVVWPEGQPERAVTCRTWIGMQWAMLGPRGLMASLRGRLMLRAWPVYEGEWSAPTIVARRTERAVRNLRRRNL